MPSRPTPLSSRYCEVLYHMGEDSIRPSQTRLAERLGVDRTAVREIERRLVRDGLVEPCGDADIKLTASGMEFAVIAVRRHRLVERLLTDVFRVGWAESYELSASWQTAVDERTEEAVIATLGYPTTCPHGNPIPGIQNAPAEGLPLTALDPERPAQVLRVTEELKFEPGMLVALESAGLTPGTTATVTSISADGSLNVQAMHTLINLGQASAAGILVGSINPAKLTGGRRGEETRGSGPQPGPG